MNYQEQIIDLLKKNNLKIATVESVTAGMISSYLASVPGASKVLLGGLVVYTNFAKTKLANVKEETLNEFGAISEECVKELSYNFNKKMQSDITIAISGNAGPNPSENKPIGFAWLAICVIDKIYTFKLNSNYKDRNDIRIDLTNLTYQKLIEVIQKITNKI